MRLSVRRLVVSAAAALGAVALLPAPATAANDRDFRTISKNFPAANVQAIRVDARVGSVRLRSSSASDVSLKLELESRREDGWIFGRRGDVRDVELETETTGGTLRLTLKGERKGINESWVLLVPARMAADVKLEVGDVEARSLEGGMRVHVNVGNIDIDVPRGEINAKVNVGDINARTGTDAYDDVALEANVGEANLRVGSQRIRSEGKRRYGPGEDVRWTGRGRDRIRMEVNVGDASLVIAKQA